MMAGIKYWDVLQGYNICHYIPVTPPPPTTALLQNIQQECIKYIKSVCLRGRGSHGNQPPPLNTYSHTATRTPLLHSTTQYNT